MSAFVSRLDEGGSGPRLAVKDIIDVAGVPTTCGSRPIAATAEPATGDAPCLAGARAAGARIVGKTTLHELAFGATGVNRWAGTPVNPRGVALVPGGSSSGAAVAVATDEADVAFGTDTGGSTRIPPACCGVTGLKTTHGRVPLDGVMPLAPSLDTVGPIARDVAGLVTGMQLLEPGFAIATESPATLGRLRLPAAAAIDEAVDDALRCAGLSLEDASAPGWDTAYGDGATILLVEAAEHHGALLQAAEPLGDDVAGKIAAGLHVNRSSREQALEGRQRWRTELGGLIDRHGLLALPTLPVPPPRLDSDLDAAELELSRLTVPVNLAGFPAVTVPVGAPDVGASVQLIGRDGSEEVLLAVAATIESAARS
jgi:amidase